MKKLTAALLAVLTAFSVSACSNAAGKNENTGNNNASGAEFKYGKIQIPGKDGALCGAPIYIAYEKGFFVEEGFDVELISADTETRKIGLNNGTIPIVNGDFQFFPSIEEGVNVKVVDGLHYGCIKLVVNPDSGIKTAADLKGKKIGVDEVGGTPHQVASVWLEQAGISALAEKGEVTFLPYSDGNLELEALKKGDIDVAAMWDPLASIAEKAGTVRTILDIAKDEPFAGKYCCFLYASSKLLNEKPDEVAALLRAYRKAQAWIADNPEEAVNVIISGNYSAIEDKDLAIELITRYEYPSESAHTKADQDETVKNNVEYFAEQLYNIGYLKTEPSQFAKDAFYKVDLK